MKNKYFAITMCKKFRLSKAETLSILKRVSFLYKRGLSEDHINKEIHYLIEKLKNAYR